MPEEKPTQKPAREPQALSTEYHKARKQVMLWAGILFIWELVGIDLAKAEATGGNMGTIISAIKNPQAVPWVLVILVVYFLFKVSVEWYQCSIARRKLPASRVDFFSAWIVSVAAYALYFGQKVSNVQLVDVLTYSTVLSIMIGVLAGYALTRDGMIFLFVKRLPFAPARPPVKLVLSRLIVSGVFIAILYGVGRALGSSVSLPYILVGVLLGVAALTGAFFSVTSKKSAPASGQSSV